jgi:long-chain acyl-CoA synthetase
MSGKIHPETLQETQIAGFSYSYEVEQEAIPGEGKARRVYSSTGPIPVTPEGVTNLLENIQAGVQKAGDRNFLGHRAMNGGVAGDYQWQSYNQVFARMKNVGYSLVDRGYKPGSNIGLFSINRPEWVISEYGCFWGGIVTVPLYDTLGDEAIEFIVQRTEMPAIFASSDKAAVLVKIAAKLPTLKTIFVMDSIPEELGAAAAKTDISLVEMKTMEKEGSEKPCPCVPLKTDTIATISFTSGTTGLPKGVLISHGNLLAFLTGYQKMGEKKQVAVLNVTDIHISYLPLAHVFERIIQVTIFNAGGSIGFYQGDTLKLMDDCAVLKPTIFASVPRLYNRIYDKVLAGAKAAGGIKTMLFNTAYKAKKYWLAKGFIRHSVWDKLVFANVRQKLGGNVKWMVTGAAPISGDVIDFLRICFSSNVTEGYGQTEGTGGSTCTHFGDMEAGHVGVPMPHVLCKLRDVPAMNYTSADKPFPRGEICFKGASIFKGYYKEEAKTKETLSADGWCYTGDIGYWDAKGRLRIIDRVKK